MSLNYIGRAIKAFNDGHSVHHIHYGDRSVAIRPGYEDGALNIDLSDGHKTEHLVNVSQLDAASLLEVWLEDQAIPQDAVLDKLWINQATRNIEVVKVTPTRVRVEYDMPKAGRKGGWWHYVDICSLRLIGYDMKKVRRILDQYRQVREVA